MICLYFFRYLYIARVKNESNNVEVMIFSNHINLLVRLALLSGLFFILFFGDHNFKDCCNYDFGSEGDKWLNPGSDDDDVTLSQVRGKMIGWKSPKWFFKFDESTLNPDNRLFHRIEVEDASDFQISTTETYKAYEETPGLRYNETGYVAQYIQKQSLNKAIYNKIVTTTGDKIYTGIVTLPYSENSPVNDKSVCGDLLLQAIIDCNFRYLHAR